MVNARTFGFSLVQGGPLYRLARRLHLVRKDGHLGWRLPILITVAYWLPLCALGLWAWHTTGTPPAILTDLSVHTRLLIAIPLFFAAERSAHMRTERCIDRFIGESWAVDDAAVRRATAAALRRRDATAPEVLMLALAVLSSQAVIGGVGSSSGLARGLPVLGEWSAPTIWYGIIALPMFQFLVYRWLWRWANWSWLLWRLSRLHLQPMATHPDRQGGLSFLSEPATAFATFLLGMSAVQAAVWADRVLFAKASLMSFKAPLIVAVALGVVITLGPLLVFVRPLWHARFEALRDYGGLGTDLARHFHARWINRAEHEGLMRTPDTSSLADFGTAYEVIRQMRVVPFGLSVILIVAGAVLLPMIPVVLIEIPLLKLLGMLGKAALGGLPK